MLFVAKLHLYAGNGPKEAKKLNKQTELMHLKPDDGKSKQKANVIGPEFYCTLHFLFIFSINGVSCCIGLIGN